MNKTYYNKHNKTTITKITMSTIEIFKLNHSIVNLRLFLSLELFANNSCIL